MLLHIFLYISTISMYIREPKQQSIVYLPFYIDSYTYTYTYLFLLAQLPIAITTHLYTYPYNNYLPTHVYLYLLYTYLPTYTYLQPINPHLCSSQPRMPAIGNRHSWSFISPQGLYMGRRYEFRRLKGSWFEGSAIYGFRRSYRGRLQGVLAVDECKAPKMHVAAVLAHTIITTPPPPRCTSWSAKGRDFSKKIHTSTVQGYIGFI